MSPLNLEILLYHNNTFIEPTIDDINIIKTLIYNYIVNLFQLFSSSMIYG